MSELASKLLQEFRAAVYHRFNVAESLQALPADIARRRATLFEAMAEEDRTLQLDGDLVRHWVVGDLRSHEQAGGADRKAIEEVLGANATRHGGYRAALQALSPDLAAGVSAGPAVSRRLGASDVGSSNLHDTPSLPSAQGADPGPLPGVWQAPVEGQLVSSAGAPAPGEDVPAPSAAAQEETAAAADLQARRARDVQLIADFIQENHARTPEAQARGLAQAPGDTHELLRDEERSRALQEEVHAKLNHLLPSRISRTWAVVATEMNYVNAQEFLDTATRQEASQAQLNAQAALPTAADRLAQDERDAQAVADFIQQHHARTPDGIARGLAQAPEQLQALLGNTQRMAEIDGAVAEKLAHLNPAYVAETAAVVAAALKSQAARELRVVADDLWARQSDSRQIPLQSSKLLLVRIQDDLAGMSHDGEQLSLEALKPEDRNTVHFAVNAAGADRGGIAIIANPHDLPTPAGWGQTESWWRLRSQHRDGRLQRRLGLGDAVIVAPAGTTVPQGAQVVFYEGGIEARDRAIEQVFARRGAKLQEAGVHEWAGVAPLEHARWQRDTSSRLWPGHEEHIRLDGYATSVDRELEGQDLGTLLADMRQHGALRDAPDGTQEPFVDAMQRRLDEVQANINKLLFVQSPPGDQHAIAVHYQGLVQRLQRQVDEARRMDPGRQVEPWAFEVLPKDRPDLQSTQHPADVGTDVDVPGSERNGAEDTVSETPASRGTVDSAKTDVAPATRGADAPLERATAEEPAHPAGCEVPSGEQPPQAPAPVRVDSSVQPQPGDAQVAQARLSFLRAARNPDPLGVLDLEREALALDRAGDQHLGFKLPRDWNGDVHVQSGNMEAEPGLNQGIDTQYHAVWLPRAGGGSSTVAVYSDISQADALAQRLAWIAQHSSPRLLDGQADAQRMAEAQPVPGPAQLPAVEQQTSSEHAYIEQIKQRHTALRDAGTEIADLDPTTLAALAAADAKAIRDIHAQDNLVAAVKELGTNASEPAYREALQAADYQVAKAVESIRLDNLVETSVRDRARHGGIEGVLVEVGTAPYEEHDGNSAVTHFMKYRDDAGQERTAWGRGLPAALIGAAAQPGDRIRFSRDPIPADVLAANQHALRADLASFTVEVVAKVRQAASADEHGAHELREAQRVAGAEEFETQRQASGVQPVQAPAAPAARQAGESASSFASHPSAAPDSTHPDSAAAALKASPAPTAAAGATARLSTEDLMHQELLRRLAGRRSRDSEQAREEAGLATTSPQAQQAEPSSSSASSVRAQGTDQASTRQPAGAVAAAGATAAQGSRLRPALDTAVNGFTGGPEAARITPEAISQMLESMTYKFQRNGSVLYMLKEQPAFVDHGEQILMQGATSQDNDEAILAAMLMAKEKWGKIEVTGSPEFKERALALMVKHGIEVELRSPQQEAMRRKLVKTGSAEMPTAGADPVPLMGRPASHPASSLEPEPSATAQQAPAAPAERPMAAASAQRAVPAADAPQPSQAAPAQPIQDAAASRPDAVHAQAAGAAHVVVSESTALRDMEDQPRFAQDMAPVDARHWWAVQRSGVEQWFTGQEREAELTRLGPQPAAGEVFWFDRSGRRCDPPEDAAQYKADVANLPQEDSTAPASLVLRGVRKSRDQFETTALLFKGGGNYLQGYMRVGERMQPVIAHISQRLPDVDTGAPRPNYLRISVNDGNPNYPAWREIGFGNAINHRADGKPVYFDEMMLNADGQALKVGVSKSVGDRLHNSLGFLEPRRKRGVKAVAAQQETAATPKAVPAAGVELAAGAARNAPRRRTPPRPAA